MFQLLSTFIIYITIFLFGMTVMKIGFKNISEVRIRQILFHMTDRPIKGILVGTLLTAILQSSSVVTVIVISLTMSNLLLFRQTIGVILGANIGTTVTGLIASFDGGTFKYVLLAIGVFFIFLPFRKLFALGTVFFGIGCIFISMDGFNTLAEPLKSISYIQNILIVVNHSIGAGVLFGALCSAIIQSSSATILIAMGFINHDSLTLTSALSIMLGANIGTCMTAILACINSNPAGRWTAYTHTLFNVLGAVLFLPFLPMFAHFISQLSPAPDTQLAYGSILFNVITALLALPLVHAYGQWVENRMKLN